jgi:diacylglycerol kinase
MPRPKKKTLVSFQHAFAGIGHVVHTQRRMRVHLALAALITGAGAWVRLSREQWFAVFTAFSLVFLADMMDTAISACVDLFAEKYHPVAGKACDVAMGATLVADVLAILMIGVIFLSSPL